LCREHALKIENEGLLGAWNILADGSVSAVGWEELDDPTPSGGWRWVHLHRDGPRSEEWLLEGETPPDTLAWALMAEDTRPRYSEIEGKGLLMLRGVNLNEGAEPEDMVSVRLFIDTCWVVTVSMRHLQSIDAIIKDMNLGNAPSSPAAFVERLVQELHERVEPVLDELEEIIDSHELDALSDTEPPDAETRAAFTDARQDAVMLRRYIAPQSATLRQLSLNPPHWLPSGELLAEEAEAFERIVEDLDIIRERAAVLRDEMTARMAERQNSIMLVLSVVSVIFLPIAFVTGLLGMNVAGMPLTENLRGFWIICAILLAMASTSALLVWWLLKR